VTFELDSDIVKSNQHA